MYNHICITTYVQILTTGIKLNRKYLLLTIYAGLMAIQDMRQRVSRPQWVAATGKTYLLFAVLCSPFQPTDWAILSRIFFYSLFAFIILYG